MKWIKIKTRKPPEFQEVLCLVTDIRAGEKNVFIGAWMGDAWVSRDFVSFPGEITHWAGIWPEEEPE